MNESVFDNVDTGGDFDAATAPKKELSPARQRAIQKMQEGKRLANDKKRKEQNRNRADQRVHTAAGHEAPHDENLEQLGADISDAEFENEVTEWARPSDLDTPPPRPGYVQRWIRIRLGTVRDTARLRRSMREGWRPVKASSAIPGHSLPIIQHDSLGDGDYIGAEDLILMEMPTKVAAQREAFYKQKKARQTGAVERQVKGVHSEDHIGFGPIRARSHSRTRLGGGQARNVAPADDEL